MDKLELYQDLLREALPIVERQTIEAGGSLATPLACRIRKALDWHASLFFYLRDPNQGDVEHEDMLEAAARPGAIMFDRSGPAEGDVEHETYVGGPPHIRHVPVGMGAVFYRKDSSP